MKQYWSEPEQTNTKTWITKKHEKDGKIIGEQSHKSKQDAWTFLETINIYVDGKLIHSAV